MNISTRNGNVSGHRGEVVRCDSRPPRRARWQGLWWQGLWLSGAALAMLAGLGLGSAAAQPAPAANAGVPGTITINEYTVLGNHLLDEIDIDNAVYPYLGPGQTVQSVDVARAALQKAYADKGYQTVQVGIPQQHVTGGVVTLQVVEVPVGRVHVNGSHYFSPNKIKQQAPSLAPGTVPNFNHVKHDVVALNEWPDREVIPTLRAGSQPQTVDVDLNVKDKLPLHGSLELNNRYSQDTTPLRINGSLSYDNLWQRGDTINFAFQVAPQNPADAQVYSGSYLARIPNVDWLTVLVYGLSSDSNVNTVGSTNVVGKGQVVGARALVALPGGSGFYDTLSAGFDYKQFDELDSVLIDNGEPTSLTNAPVTYYPFTATYSGSWQGDTGNTQLDIGPTFNMRGYSNDSQFGFKRLDAEANFIYLKGDLSRTQDLPRGFQLFAKLQGQLSDQPLLESEQFSMGGQDTVRGYLESEVLVDNGMTTSVELRSPQLAHYLGPRVDDWRIFVFNDDGWGNLLDTPPEQNSKFALASVGAGTRIQLFNDLNGQIDVAVPLRTSVATQADHARVEFRVWVQF